MTVLARLRDLRGVVRAWPATQGQLTFEQRDDQGRLRAGRILADGAVELADYATDPELAELRVPEGTELVVHRLGRRAVVMGQDHVTKAVRAGRAGRVVVASREMGGLIHRAGFSAAEVLGATDARIDFSVLPGRTLHDLGRAGMPGWQVFAQAWPALTAMPALLPPHGPDDEAETLTRWVSAVRRFDALPQIDALERASAEACAALVAGDGSSVVAHRDLHDKQMLWDGQRLGLLDLDTAARAEAALDLANLWVHVELRRAQGVFPVQVAMALFDLLDGVAARLPTTMARLAAYRQAARLRLCCVYAFRPSAWGWLPRWCDDALGVAEREIS